MRKIFRITSLVISCFLLAVGTNAQIIADPTTWSYEVKKTGENQYDLVFHLKIYYV